MENKSIVENWNEGKLLGCKDCYVNKSGTVILLETLVIEVNSKKLYHCNPFCDTTVENLQKYNQDLWSEYSVFTNVVQTENGDLIFGGEGEMGNEGCIISTTKDKKFNWSLFFKTSNPFYKLELIASELYAYSSCDLVYIVNIKTQNIISIKECFWR